MGKLPGWWQRRHLAELFRQLSQECNLLAIASGDLPFGEVSSCGNCSHQALALLPTFLWSFSACAVCSFR